MEKKAIIVALLVVFVIASDMKLTSADASDCLDACTTACVQRDPRLEARCNRKCDIRCGPDSQAFQNADGNKLEGLKS